MKVIRTAFVLGLLASLMFATMAFAADSAADLYKAKCAMCHGPDGSKTNPAMGVKALNSPDVQKLSDADLTASITNGKGKMPAYKGKLTDEQIKSLVAYVRSLKK